MAAVLAKLKADLTTVKAYVVEHYKQLGVAALVGKYSAVVVAAVTALVKHL
jgi:hypothetical protein